MRLNKRTVLSAATLAFAGGVMLTGSAVTASASPDAGSVAGPASATSVFSSKSNEMVVCRGVLSGGGVFSATATAGGSGAAGAVGPGSLTVGADGKVVTSGGAVVIGGSVSVGPDGKVTSGDLPKSGDVPPPLPGIPAGAKAIGVIVGADGKVTASDKNIVVREGSAAECAAGPTLP